MERHWALLLGSFRIDVLALLAGLYHFTHQGISKLVCSAFITAVSASQYSHSKLCYNRRTTLHIDSSVVSPQYADCPANHFSRQRARSTYSDFSSLIDLANTTSWSRRETQRCTTTLIWKAFPAINLNSSEDFLFHMNRLEHITNRIYA